VQKYVLSVNLNRIKEKELNSRVKYCEEKQENQPVNNIRKFVKL